MKRIFLLLIICAFICNVRAQNKEVFGMPKLSGYAIGQYQYSDKHNSESNTFSLRIVRLSLDGRILNDFAYKLQGQVNGNTTTLSESPRIVDVYIEWQRYKYAMLKIGQFKRPFTFENPMNPIDQGFMSYAQNVTNLAGFTDRSGEHSSNGRDIGIQLQGDIFRTGNGRALLHYQIGIFNGQGINTKDIDNQKDIIGGVWVMPLSGMRIGAFGWTGSYARKDNNGIKSLSKHRYAISGEYVINDWTFRSEYIHSKGFGFETVYNDKTNLNDSEVDYESGDDADGFYALIIAPIVKNKLHVKGRYDMYRPSGEWNNSKTYYEIGADYEFAKNLKLSAEYIYVNDRSLDKHNYSMIDTQLSFRF